MRRKQLLGVESARQCCGASEVTLGDFTLADLKYLRRSSFRDTESQELRCVCRRCLQVWVAEAGASLSFHIFSFLYALGAA